MSTAKQDSAALAKKPPPSPLAQWHAEVLQEKTLANLGKALQGTGTSAERFAFTCYMTVARAPNLLVPPRQQLWMGVYGAAECGLSLQPHMQHMHLVPFNVSKPAKAQVQPIVGYQGLTYLVGKAGQGLMDVPVVVYQRDIDEGRFRYRQGTNRTCRLDPTAKNAAAPRGIVRYAFCTFTSAAGVTTFHCIDRDELLAAQATSAGWRAFRKGDRKESPWEPVIMPDGSEGGPFIAMCQKTVARRFAKYLPKSTDHWGERAAKAEAVDDVTERGEGSLAEILDTAVQERVEETGNDALRRELGTDDAETEGAS